MLKLETKCNWCGKTFKRDTRRINEAKKFKWKQFCSPRCLQQSHQKGKELVCGNSDCNKSFYRPLKEIIKKKKHFCSSHCFAITNNKARGLLTSKKCLNESCNRSIYPYKKFCSISCFQQYRRKKFLLQYKQKVLITIKKFFKLNKRVPLKQEMYDIYKPARIVFGTWNKAVEAAGYKPNQLKFTHKYIANDKDVCDSLAEKIIDDWLFARKINHQRSVYYPGQKKFKTDFKIGNYWIEFFGLSGQLLKYDKLKLQKIKLAKKLNLKLIAIYPHDLFPENQLANRLVYLLH